MPPDGSMSLADHLRELRYRVVVSALAFIVATSVCFFFYDQLYMILLQPYLQGAQMLKQSHPGITTQAINTGFVSPFMLWLKICGIAGLICSCPIWLYQLWAFIVPGLLAKEKKYALQFLAAAIPLFLLGVAVGYWILPQGIAVMIAFTPDSVPVANLVDLSSFLDLLVLMMVIFGACFLLPVVVVLMNFAGIVSAQQLGKIRKYAIFVCFVIGAIATPSSDPFSMLALAIPLTALYLVGEVVCHIHDRRKARKESAA